MKAVGNFRMVASFDLHSHYYAKQAFKINESRGKPYYFTLNCYQYDNIHDYDGTQGYHLSHVEKHRLSLPKLSIVGTELLRDRLKIPDAVESWMWRILAPCGFRN